MLRRNLQRIFTCGQKQECGLQDQGQQVQEQQDELVETVLEAFEKFHDFRKVDKTLSSMVQDSAHPRQSLQTIASSIFHGDFDENVGDKDSNLGSEDSNLGSEDSNLAFDPNPTEREVLEEIVYSPHYNQHIASPLENTGKILGRILIKLAHDERITLTSRSATIVILESLIETLPKEKQNQKNEANVTAKVNLLSESILCCCRRSPSKNDYDNIIRPSINHLYYPYSCILSTILYLFYFYYQRNMQSLFQLYYLSLYHYTYYWSSQLQMSSSFDKLSLFPQIDSVLTKSRECKFSLSIYYCRHN